MSRLAPAGCSCRGHETYLGTGRLGNLGGLEFFVLEPVLILLHIESRICHHLSFLLNVITAWHIKPNTREKQPPPNSDAPHPAPDIVIKPPTKKIPMPRNIPTP